MTDTTPEDVVALPPEVQTQVDFVNQRYTFVESMMVKLDAMMLASESALPGVPPEYGAQAQWLIENGQLTLADLQLDNLSLTPADRALIIQTKMDAFAAHLFTRGYDNVVWRAGLDDPLSPQLSSNVEDYRDFGFSDTLANFTAGLKSLVDRPDYHPNLVDPAYFTQYLPEEHAHLVDLYPNLTLHDLALILAYIEATPVQWGDRSVVFSHLGNTTDLRGRLKIHRADKSRPYIAFRWYGSKHTSSEIL